MFFFFKCVRISPEIEGCHYQGTSLAATCIVQHQTLIQVPSSKVSHQSPVCPPPRLASPGRMIIDSIKLIPWGMGISFQWIGLGIFEAAGFPFRCFGKKARNFQTRTCNHINNLKIGNDWLLFKPLSYLVTQDTYQKKDYMISVILYKQLW